MSLADVRKGKIEGVYFDASIPILETKRPIQYKYSEDKTLAEMKDYVDATYSQHYAGSKNIQVFELIEQRGYGVGFCVGAIIKYAYRYGLKGYDRKDLLKMIHYAMFLLHIHDTENKAVDK